MNILEAIKYMEAGNICIRDGYLYKIEDWRLYYKSKIDDQWEIFTINFRNIKSEDWERFNINIKTSAMNIKQALNAMQQGFVCAIPGGYEYKFHEGDIYFKSKLDGKWCEDRNGFTERERKASDWEILYHFKDKAYNLNFREVRDAMMAGEICILRSPYGFPFQHRMVEGQIQFRLSSAAKWASCTLSPTEISSHDWKILRNEYTLTFREAQEKMQKGYICCDEEGVQNKIENGKLYYLYDNVWIPCGVYTYEQFTRSWKVVGRPYVPTITHTEDELIDWASIPHRIYVPFSGGFYMIDDPHKPKEMSFKEAKEYMLQGYFCSNSKGIKHKIENGILRFLHGNVWIRCDCQYSISHYYRWKLLELNPYRGKMEPIDTRLSGFNCESINNNNVEISCIEALEAMNEEKIVQCLDTKTYQRKIKGQLQISYSPMEGWTNCVHEHFTQQEILSKWRVL